MPRSLETSRFRVDDHVDEIGENLERRDFRRKVFRREIFLVSSGRFKRDMFGDWYLGDLMSRIKRKRRENAAWKSTVYGSIKIPLARPIHPLWREERQKNRRGSSPRSGGRERCADCTEISKSHSRLGYPLAASGQTFKSASPATRGGERIVRARSLSAIVALFFFYLCPPACT